jgi:hypothetical protein
VYTKRGSTLEIEALWNGYLAGLSISLVQKNVQWFCERRKLGSNVFALGFICSIYFEMHLSYMRRVFLRRPQKKFGFSWNYKNAHRLSRCTCEIGLTKSDIRNVFFGWSDCEYMHSSAELISKSLEKFRSGFVSSILDSAPLNQKRWTLNKRITSLIASAWTIQNPIGIIVAVSHRHARVGKGKRGER